MKRPITTLFMLLSVDGKISTGSGDALDFDQDLPYIPGLGEGLGQYYEIEQTTDLWSLCSGKTQAKIGINQRQPVEKSPVSFVLIDNQHLQPQGLRFFCSRARELLLVTTNPQHPAFSIEAENLHILLQPRLDLRALLETLYRDYGCQRLTLQSGGSLNTLFLREGLIDFVDLVVAPLLVGGRDTPTLLDGESLTRVEQLSALGVLELESATPLECSYLRLRYRVRS